MQDLSHQPYVVVVASPAVFLVVIVTVVAVVVVVAAVVLVVVMVVATRAAVVAPGDSGRGGRGVEGTIVLYLRFICCFGGCSPLLTLLKLQASSAQNRCNSNLPNPMIGTPKSETSQEAPNTSCILVTPLVMPPRVPPPRNVCLHANALLRNWV